MKLLINDTKASHWKKTTSKEAEFFWKKLSGRKEVQEAVIATLIKNGEICGTSIISEDLLKTELGKTGAHLPDREKGLHIVNSSMRRAKYLAKSKGPLIFMRVDKRYYRFS